MKVVAKPVEMLLWVDDKGTLHPVKFRCEGTVIKIDRVISMDVNRLAGNSTLVFTCQGIINQQDRVFEVRYELRTCRWTLFKI